MDVQYEKVCALLTDTIMLMCKNGVQFRNELKVQGLIGLTVDKHVFIIQINDIVKAEEQVQKRPKVDSEASLGGINFADNDSTQEIDVINNPFNNVCNQKGKSQRNQRDLPRSLRQPVEANKKEDEDAIKDDVDARQVPFQNLRGERSPADLLEEVDAFPNVCEVVAGRRLFDKSNEQNSPIDLHVGTRPIATEGDRSANEPPDIKPLTGELEEWIANNAMSLDRGSNGRLPCMRGHETKRSEVLNLKTNRSYDANASCSPFPPGPIRYNEKKRPVCDDYDYEECEVSKFSCNLCPAAYKHYCNLLTHEVKVHGRQKKKGGRRKKLV